jgi:hypothetical protein
MRSTAFPTTPSDVVALSAAEFACTSDVNQSVSLDAVCRRFLDDVNRAVVWLIRFRALTAWCERRDIAEWLRAEPIHVQHAGQVAASFALNDDWEFDAEPFRSAVEAAGRVR